MFICMVFNKMSFFFFLKIAHGKFLFVHYFLFLFVFFFLAVLNFILFTKLVWNGRSPPYLPNQKEINLYLYLSLCFFLLLSDFHTRIILLYQNKNDKYLSQLQDHHNELNYWNLLHGLNTKNKIVLEEIKRVEIRVINYEMLTIFAKNC